MLHEQITIDDGPEIQDLWRQIMDLKAQLMQCGDKWGEEAAAYRRLIGDKTAQIHRLRQAANRRRHAEMK